MTEAKTLFSLGYRKFEKLNFKSAINYFTQVIAIKPNIADVYYWRGQAKQILKHYQGAINDYEEAIKINPHNPKYYVGSGSSKFAFKCYLDALEEKT